MSSTNTIGMIDVGDAVYSSDGDNVGTVAAVYPGYIALEKGVFFPTDFYIPQNAIGSTSGSDVFLRVSKDEVLNQGWDREPADLDTATIGLARDMAATNGAGYEATAEDEIRIPVMEEELTATVRPQQAGAVRVEKDVVTEQRTLDVPVTDERVRVERRVVDRPADAVAADAFQEIIVDVPVMREAVDVQKQARVTEEVVLSKEAVQRTERVTDTVRREQVTIDEDADIETMPIDNRETGIGAQS